MVTSFIVGLIGFVTFGFLDYTWLAHIAKNFYLNSLSAHITIKNGSLVPYLVAVPFVYIVAVFSIFVFVLPKASTVPNALLYGAILGFCLYSFYDFTNLATLKDYTWKLTSIDIIWGTFAVGIVSGVMFYTQKLLS